mmetsp:Transcript_287/g.675  ORF Transcript_287/g.675 Transcript_287/m.675 type:complete len:216 (+) Transcript_287:181-828(+)
MNIRRHVDNFKRIVPDLGHPKIQSFPPSPSAQGQSTQQYSDTLLLIIVSRDHVDEQPLPQQPHLVHLRHFSVVVSNHGYARLMGLHHDAVGHAVVEAAHFHQAFRHELALVHRVVVEPHEPSPILRPLALVVLVVGDLLLLLFDGGGSGDGHVEAGRGRGGGRRDGGARAARLRRPVGGGVGRTVRYERRRRQELGGDRQHNEFQQRSHDCQGVL